MSQEEMMEYDVIIVGGGPSGLSAAIKLKQLAIKNNLELRLCIVEKGAYIGAHILSGAVLETRSLRALLPDNWQQAPLNTSVKKIVFIFSPKKRAFPVPVPKLMQNQGNYIISLGELCQFLANYAESLGCEIYPGFSATTILYNKKGDVIGIETGEMGRGKDGNKTAHFQPGMHLYAHHTFFAEGCRGQLSQQLMARYHLRDKAQPQTYGLGIKEIWKIDPKQHQEGLVSHTLGWPLDRQTYGGSFIYHFSQSRVSIGFVVGLDYKNPWLDPFAEFQRFKTHPAIRPILEGGERISYGARALNEGGWQSLPQLVFPGGSLIGDAAGFLNVVKIKGIHAAIESGMLAAEAYFNAFQHLREKKIKKPKPLLLLDYPEKFKTSWLAKELYKVRNIRPGFRYGLVFGLVNAAVELYLTHGKLPWNFKTNADYTMLLPASKAKKINYPPPDNVISFDKLSSLYLANVYHEENQPSHLTLENPQLVIQGNYLQYASPETRYCPAAVYELIQEEKGPRLQINAQNCIHCKTCDIKDPFKNIIWQAPEGGADQIMLECDETAKQTLFCLNNLY